MSEPDEIQRAIVALGEHWDTVQIFTSRMGEKGDMTTQSRQTGTGNLFARIGQVRQWMIANEEQERIDQRKFSEGKGDE